MAELITADQLIDGVRGQNHITIDSPDGSIYARPPDNYP
jgi:hypothetical protein